MKLVFFLACDADEIASLIMRELENGRNSPFFHGLNSPPSKEELIELQNNVVLWSVGKGETFSAVQEDGPWGNGVDVKTHTLRVWVGHSLVKIDRVSPSQFLLEAEGARCSFSENHTGQIARKLMSMASGEVIVESHGQPWDNTGEAVFGPTLEARTKNFFEGQEALKNPAVKTAVEQLLAVLASNYKE